MKNKNSNFKNIKSIINYEEKIIKKQKIDIEKKSLELNDTNKKNEEIKAKKIQKFLKKKKMI